MQKIAFLAAFLLSHAVAAQIATRDPVPTDDSTQGYAVGNRWVNSTNGGMFTAGSVAPAAAVWTPPSLAYPAEIGPALPVLAYGTAKLKSAAAYNIAVWNATPLQSQYLPGWIGDKMDAAGMDAFLAGQMGLDTFLWDQTGGGNHAAQGLTGTPLIQGLSIGPHRAIVFEGGSQSGALYGIFVPGTIAPLNITPQNYTVIAVVQPSAAVARNQAGPLQPTSGTLVSFNLSDGHVLNLIENGAATAVGWGVSDANFSWTNTVDAVETSPSVVMFSSSAAGTTIRQNEITRTTAGHSSYTAAATVGMIGQLTTSVAGASSLAFDGRLAALLVYNTAISSAEADQVFLSLYQRFAIAPQRAVDQAVMVGDSIATGFATFGLAGTEKLAQTAVANQARWVNDSVPGSTITQQVPGAPVYAYTVGMFPGVVAPIMGASSHKNVLIVWGGGNDCLITPTPSAATVMAGISSVVAQGKAAGASSVIVGTLLPRTGGYQSCLDGINALIRAGAGPSTYTLWDVAADPVIGVVPPNPAYYADGVHPNSAGHQIAANDLAPIVNAAMGW